MKKARSTNDHFDAKNTKSQQFFPQIVRAPKGYFYFSDFFFWVVFFNKKWFDGKNCTTTIVVSDRYNRLYGLTGACKGCDPGDCLITSVIDSSAATPSAGNLAVFQSPFLRFLLDIKTFLWLTFRISRHFFESQCEVDSITTTTHCLRKKKSFSAWGCWKREAVKRALRNVNNRIAAFLESLLRCPLFFTTEEEILYCCSQWGNVVRSSLISSIFINYIQ